MNWKTTIIMAAVCIVGGGYLYFVDSKQLDSQKVGELRKKVFKVKDLSDGVDMIKLSRLDGEFEFHRSGDESSSPWLMKEPLIARADKSNVKSIASGLEDMAVQSVVEVSGGLSEYGLEKPRVTVNFDSEGQSYSLLIGKAGPKKNTIFVKSGDENAVYLTNDSFYDKVKKSTEEFRDKKVVNIDKSDATNFTLVWSDKEKNKDIAASKTGDNWNLTAPVKDLGDKSKLEELIGKIEDLDVDKEDFYTESMDDPAKFGLDKPALKVVIKTKADEEEKKAAQTFEISFGKAVEGKEDKIYAKRKDEPTVFGVKKDILKDLAVEELKDVRSDDFAVFEDDDVTKIEISLATGEAIVEKHEEKKDDGSSSEVKWKVTKPKETGADKSAVDDFIDAIDSAKVDEFTTDEPKDEDLEKYGLKKPAAKLTLTVKDADPVSIEIGNAHADEEEKFYARRTGSESIYLVKKKSLHKDLLSGHLLFRNKRVTNFSSSAAKKIVVTKGDKTVALTKSDDWQLTQPVTAKADKDRINGLLWQINSLNAVRFISENKDDLSNFGLDKPHIKVSVEVKDDDAGDDSDKLKEGTVTLLIGEKVEDEDEYYATLADGPNKDVTFTISKYGYGKLDTEFHDREIIDVTKSDVEELTLRYADTAITCKLEGEDDDKKWKVTSPQEAEGEKSEIENLLDELDPLKADRIASYRAKTGPELAPFGLDTPELTITLKMKDKKEKIIHIGKLLKDGEDEFFHVRADDKDAVFLIKDSKAKDLRKKFEDLAKVEKKEEEAEEKKEVDGKPEKKEEDGKQEKKEEDGKQEKKEEETK